MGTWKEAGLEYLLTYGWAILIIIVVVGALYTMGVFDGEEELNDYSSETKAFKSENYNCDLYIEYENNKVRNITLIDCIEVN